MILVSSLLNHNQKENSLNMKKSHDFPFQFQIKEVPLLIGDISCSSCVVVTRFDQDFSCAVTSPKQQMTQIACMLHFLIIADISLLKIFQHTI